MEALTVWTDENVRWYTEQEGKWKAQRRKSGSLLIQLSGLAFVELLAILFYPGGPSFSAGVALLMWVNIAMICLCAASREYVISWLQWHQDIRGIPDLYEWPPMPCEAR